MKTMKQIMAGLLVAVMLVAGIVLTPASADASETETIENGENGVIYVLDETNLKFSDYWTVDAKAAPTRAGFVFGGWYIKDGEEMKAIKESDGKDITSAYAKFVPAEVLSVRAQLETATEEGNGNTDSTYLRLLSGVNGLDYQKVGFDIYYNKKHHEDATAATNITKVFSTITNSETGSQPITANTIFGSAATHFSVLRLAEIKQVNYKYVIYVTPQWTTLDGTLVEGQGKYVRVMDGYADNHFISVPVNFLSGSQVAAGQMEMTYDSRLEVVAVEGMATAGFDTGEIMTGMSYQNDTTVTDGKCTVKIVGNIDKAPDDDTVGVEPETGIYANVWFKVTDPTVDTSDIDAWEFGMKNFSFANWDENMVKDLIAWDFKYFKQ